MTDLLSLSDKYLDREIERIIKTSNKLTRRPWTEKEDAILKRLYEARLSHRDIAKALNRSIHSIDNKIETMSS